MNKLNLLIIIIISLCLNACSSNDDELEITTKNIVGSWISVSKESYEKDNLTGEISDYFKGEYTYLKLKYYEDNTFELVDQYYTLGGNYELSNDRIKMVYYGLDNSIGGYRIEKLESNRMVISSTSRITYSYKGGTIVSDTEYFKIYTMRRVN